MRSLTIGLALLASAASLSAQEITATLHGTVLDNSGGRIPSVRVVASSDETGARFSAVASQSGDFTLRSLPPGLYAIQLEADGFRPLRQTNVQLSSGQRTQMDFTLEVGAVSQAIEVTASAPSINSVNAELRSNVESRQVMELPVARRDWTRMIELENGMNNVGGRVSMNGLPSAGFRLTVDGTDSTMDNEAPSFAAPDNYNFIRGVSMEAVQEVNIARGIASAEIGQTMSGNINVNTKRGTNQYHGSLFALNQTEDLNARLQFLSAKPGVVYNQFGGSFGGPVVKNRLFGFGVFEGYRLRGFQSLVGNVPTVDLKQRAIAAVPAYKTALDLFPDPNTPVVPGSTNATYVGADSEKAQDNHAVVRGDYHAADSLILSARYTRGRPFREVPRLARNPRTFSGVSEIGTLNATYIRPSWTAETRFGANHNRTDRVDYLQAAGIPGITGGLGWSITGETLKRNGFTWSFEELIGMTRGRHSLKFGFIYSNPAGGRDNVESPEVNYANLPDFLANLPTRVRVTFGVREFRVSAANMGFFLQDDFRVSRRLTLNLGIRWDYFSVPNERDNRLFNRDEPFGFGPWLPSSSIWKATYNDFSPRLGFAWTLDSTARTVLRAGAGIFQNPRPLFGGPVDIVQNSLEEPFRVEYARTDVLRYSDLLRYPVINDKVLPIAVGPQALKGGTAINPNWGTPMSYQWLLTVQRQLPWDTALETGYVGTRGLGLMMVRFMNQPDRLTGIRPVDGFAQFRYRDGEEHSHYHAWQSSLRKRFGSGLLVTGNYTWSRLMSYTNAADLLLPVAPQDTFNVRADYGPANADTRHRFVSSFLYELPLKRLTSARGTAVRLVLDGLQVSGIFTGRTGNPITLEQPTGLDASRPDYLGGVGTLEDSKATLQYLNRAAFARVPLSPVSGLPVRPGSVGRSALYGLGASNLDLTVAKSLDFTERLKMQLRMDMLNALNHTNLSGVVVRIDAANFGRFTGTGGARVVQLGARLAF